MEQILKYFPQLSDRQVAQYEALYALYVDWNAKINVISRKDITNLYERHVLHSLGIATFIHFKPNTRILDVGTGGGFPGIPLAIMFPECRFKLIDGICKKVRVAQAVADSIGLQNVGFAHQRAEEEEGTYHFVVSRGVSSLSELYKLTAKRIAKEQFNAIPNGLLCLKGGELQDESRPFARKVLIHELNTVFKEEFFQTKKVVYLSI